MKLESQKKAKVKLVKPNLMIRAEPKFGNNLGWTNNNEEKRQLLKKNSILEKKWIFYIIYIYIYFGRNVLKVK